MLLLSLLISLNPSFSGCPALGSITPITPPRLTGVLIPLLVDVPLWDRFYMDYQKSVDGLNPSFSGCPALGRFLNHRRRYHCCLNPSFSGCPALGYLINTSHLKYLSLNPSFSGCPALGSKRKFYGI